MIFPQWMFFSFSDPFRVLKDVSILKFRFVKPRFCGRKVNLIHVFRLSRFIPQIAQTSPIACQVLQLSRYQWKLPL